MCACVCVRDKEMETCSRRTYITWPLAQSRHFLQYRDTRVWHRTFLLQKTDPFWSNRDCHFRKYSIAIWVEKFSVSENSLADATDTSTHLPIYTFCIRHTYIRFCNLRRPVCVHTVNFNGAPHRRARTMCKEEKETAWTPNTIHMYAKPC